MAWGDGPPSVDLPEYPNPWDSLGCPIFMFYHMCLTLSDAACVPGAELKSSLLNFSWLGLSQGLYIWFIWKTPPPVYGRIHLTSLQTLLCKSRYLACSSPLPFKTGKKKKKAMPTVWVIWFISDNYIRMRWTAPKSANFSPLRRKGAQAPWYKHQVSTWQIICAWAEHLYPHASHPDRRWERRPSGEILLLREGPW